MRLAAYLNLGLHLARVLVRRAVGGSNGLLAIERTYLAEGHRPVDPDERALRIALGRCIACGLCDAVSQVPEPGYPGPMAVVLGACRDPRADDLLASLARPFLREDHARLETVCPTRVPFRHLAARLRAD